MSIQRPMRKTHNLIMLIGALAVVYGCSSGGGSSGGDDTPTTRIEPETPREVQSPTQTTLTPHEESAQENAVRPVGVGFEAEIESEADSQSAGMAAQNRPLFGSVTQGTRTFDSEIGEETLDHFTITLKSSPSAYNDVVVNMDFDNDAETLNLGTDTAVVRRTVQPNSVFPYLRRVLGESQEVSRTLNNQFNDFLQCNEANCSHLRPASLPAHGVGGYEIELVDWTTSDDNYYMGGGIWTYDLYGDFAIRGTSLTPEVADAFTFKPWGAFVDGDEADLTNLPTTGSATYVGQTYGRLFTLPVPQNSTAIEHFTADMRMRVSFSDTPTISGEVRNFVFRDFSFPDFRVLLGEAEINTGENHFEGDVTSTGLFLDPDDTLSDLTLSGKWGGRFFGTPPNVGDAPLAAGGTWGADGRRGDPEDGGFRLTLLGAFGLKRPTPPSTPIRPVGVAFKATADQDALDEVRYAGFLGTAFHEPLFNESSVSQGGGGPRHDAVFLTRSTDPETSVITTTALSIDLADAGSTTRDRIIEMDLTGTPGAADSHVASDFSTPAADDRRATSLGTEEAAWGYRTRHLAITSAEQAAIQTRLADEEQTNAERLGDGVTFYESSLVNWTDADDDYYMAGGVWTYHHADTFTAEVDVSPVAFVDGDATNVTENPLPTSDTAIYTGHSYGRYTTLPTLSGVDINAGYFAATATLTADFANTQVSGTVSDFLFSTDRSFTAETESPLEDAFPNMVVTLGAGAITGNQFSGPTTTDGVLLDASDQNSELELTGRWGGRFFGAAGDATTPEAPPAVGGTWGAAGGTDLAPEDGGFSISFIGSFGAKRPPTAP